VKLTKLSKSYLVVDTTPLFGDAGRSVADALLLVMRQTSRAGRDLREAVVEVLKDRGALVDTAKYVIIDDHPPTSLPADRVKYKDRRKYPELVDLNPIEFLKVQYREFVDQGTLYQHQLSVVDPQLLKAIRNYVLRHPDREPEFKNILKTRYKFAQERVDIDAEALADEELKRDIKSMAYNLNRPPAARRPR
jgi:hypothetical protein